MDIRERDLLIARQSIGTTLEHKIYDQFLFLTKLNVLVVFVAILVSSIKPYDTHSRCSFINPSPPLIAPSIFGQGLV